MFPSFQSLITVFNPQESTLHSSQYPTHVLIIIYFQLIQNKIKASIESHCILISCQNKSKPFFQNPKIITGPN